LVIEILLEGIFYKQHCCGLVQLSVPV